MSRKIVIHKKMPITTIHVTLEVKKKLIAATQNKETYSQTIDRLLKISGVY